MTQRGSHADEYEDDDVPEWTDQVHATIAAEVRRRRKELKWSAQDLADRCAEIGHPIARSVIANMESGRRAMVPLVDVIALAQALEAPPVSLIYPVGYVDDVQQLPLQDSVSTLTALRWFTGEERHLGMQDEMLRYFRAHHAAEKHLRDARRDEEYARHHAETSPTADRRAEALRSQARAAEAADDAASRLRRIRAFIREEGVTPPHLWSDLAAEVDDLPDADTEEEAL